MSELRRNLLRSRLFKRKHLFMMLWCRHFNTLKKYKMLRLSIWATNYFAQRYRRNDLEGYRYDATHEVNGVAGFMRKRHKQTNITHK